MKSIVLAILLAFATLFSHAQSTQQPPPAVQKPEELLDHWRRATIALGIMIEDPNDSKAPKNFRTWGSGVIVAFDETGRRAGLLTAKHMVQDADTGQLVKELWMRFPSVEGEEEAPIQLLLFDDQGRPVWRTSPASGDLALIPMPQVAWAHKGLHGLSIKDFASPEDDLFQGASVLVLGYPAVVGEDFLSAPIARGGMVAWVNPKNPADEPFLVDANLFSGNSGGPVFRVRNGLDKFGTLRLGGVGYAFLGIVSKGPKQTAHVEAAGGNVYQEDPITKALNPETVTVKNIGGIGIIEPASRARNLIQELIKLLPPAEATRAPSATVPSPPPR
jgi:hypothetical protein